MKYPKILFVIFSFSLLLAACSPFNKPVPTPLSEPDRITLSPSIPDKDVTPAENVGTSSRVTPESIVTPAQGGESQQVSTQSDTQGAVVVEVKPVNLASPGDNLSFEVSMDTHSVDLSMDLTKLAVLMTDTGKKVAPVSWDGPRGGHHVKGILSFPASIDGEKILSGRGTITITITIKDVDAPQRTFTWQIQG